MDEFREHNEAVNKFKSKVLRGLKASAAGFSHGKSKPFITRKRKGLPDQTEKKIMNSISSRTRMDGEMIESVSFSFERHGIFVIKGVSRKHNVKNPRVLKDWTNSVLDKETPILADKIAEITADRLVLKLRNP
jgi:hypothetical protein